MDVFDRFRDDFLFRAVEKDAQALLFGQMKQIAHHFDTRYAGVDLTAFQFRGEQDTDAVRNLERGPVDESPQRFIRLTLHDFFRIHSNDGGLLVLINALGDFLNDLFVGQWSDVDAKVGLFVHRLIGSSPLKFPIG